MASWKLCKKSNFVTKYFSHGLWYSWNNSISGATSLNSYRNECLVFALFCLILICYNRCTCRKCIYHSIGKWVIFTQSCAIFPYSYTIVWFCFATIMNEKLLVAEFRHFQSFLGSHAPHIDSQSDEIKTKIRTLCQNF